MRTKFPAIMGAAALLLSPLPLAREAGVTIITHGFNGNVTDWIIPMAQQIPGHDSFPGSAFSRYRMTVDSDRSVSQSRVGGVSPLVSDSGEIIISLDWSSSATDPFTASQDIANATVPSLLSTTFVPELGGRSLAEFPIHLIGHSRGGSVVTEMARLLGHREFGSITKQHSTRLPSQNIAMRTSIHTSTFYSPIITGN